MGLRLQQIWFIYLLLSTSLTTSKFNDRSVADYRSWRRNVAHNIVAYDQLGGRALAWRVCQYESGLPYNEVVQSVVKQVDTYLSGNGVTGRTMTWLALIAWYCSASRPGYRKFVNSVPDRNLAPHYVFDPPNVAAVSKEIYGTLMAFRVTLSIPRGPVTKIVNEDGAYSIKSINFKRVVVRLTISAMRLGIAAFMWEAGTRFLVYTIEMSDLLLNAGEPSAGPKHHWCARSICTMVVPHPQL